MYIRKGGICIYDGIRFNHKKEEILPFVKTWMGLEGVTLGEISQTEKDKYRMIGGI